MDGQVEVTWKTFHTSSHSLMVHARLMESYIHFAFMYTSDHIFPVISIKDFINKDGKPTTPYKLATGMKPPILHLCLLFFPCVVRKDTTYVGTRALNMRHQAQKFFHGIFIGISQHQKGYIFYVPHKQEIVSSYDVVFCDTLSSMLDYTSQPYTEAMDIRPAVSCIPYDISSRGGTGNIITFTKF